MNLLKGKMFLAVILALVLMGTACIFSPEVNNNNTSSEYYSPVDSAYKALANFQLAYTMKDIDRYMDCLHEEFEFILLEADWNDYTGNGEVDKSWGRDMEEKLTGNMFASEKAGVIELLLEGNSQDPWYNDPSGEAIQMPRSFELKVYYEDSEGVQQGYRAAGQAIFFVKPNDNEEYQIFRWEDRSSV